MSGKEMSRREPKFVGSRGATFRGAVTATSLTVVNFIGAELTENQPKRY